MAQTLPANELDLYLGQDPPGSTSQLFAPGILSTPGYESSITFTPDQKEIYYMSGSWRENPVILVTRFDGENWTEPEVASFSGTYKDGFPSVSPDGRRLFFTSNRPVSPGQDPVSDQDIWFVKRVGEGWSAPVHPGDAVNTGERENSPSITITGRLYFTRYENQEANIYYADPSGSGFENAIKLDTPVNSERYETYPFIDPDERFLLLSIWRHPDGYGEADLFISYMSENQTWSTPENLGKSINSEAHENAGVVTSDGKYLIYCSYRVPAESKEIALYTGQPNFFWVSFTLTDR